MATLAIDLNQFDLATFIRKIEHGEAVLLTRNGQTVATVSPAIYPAQNTQPAKTRQVGKWTLGLLQNVCTPASFDDRLDDELLDLFEGRDTP